MLSNELILDAFERIKSVVHQTTKDLSVDDLTYRPTDSANSIAWLVWHLTRIQDDHIANLAKDKQVWAKTWFERFELPFEVEATGYGHNSNDVAEVKVNAKLLLGYYDDVHSASIKFISNLTQKDYLKIIDTRWKPPVTLAIRLISVISDNLQHAGQAAYVRGILK